jgi:hypothetical protein
VPSSTTRGHNFEPPKLFVVRELVLIKILSPGIVLLVLDSFITEFA